MAVTFLVRHSYQKILILAQKSLILTSSNCRERLNVLVSQQRPLLPLQHPPLQQLPHLINLHKLGQPLAHQQDQRLPYKNSQVSPHNLLAVVAAWPYLSSERASFWIGADALTWVLDANKIRHTYKILLLIIIVSMIYQCIL